MSQAVIDDCKQRMRKSIDVLIDDLAAIRAGKANPKVLDRLVVDYYGTEVPINQAGNISVPEPRMIMITPYDAGMITEIEKAIQASDLGLNPANDGKVIRLVFPELTEERRKDIFKTVKNRIEEAKIAVRAIRRDGMDKLKKMQKDGELTEDELKAEEKIMQEKTDTAVKKIEEIQKDKEDEIMNV